MDPISIAAGTLGAKFLVEGIKFLWGEAAKILERFHKRREIKDAAEIDEPAPEKLELPAKRTIDFNAVEKRFDDLEAVIAALGLYTSGARPIDVADKKLLQKADELQRLIVEVYGIDAPGLRLSAKLDLDKVEGTAIGNLLTNVSSADARADIKAKTVTKAGTLIGNKAEDM